MNRKYISVILAAFMLIGLLPAPKIAAAAGSVAVTITASDLDFEAVYDGYYYGGNDGFYEGLLPVRKNGKWGFVDKTGAAVIPFEYDGAEGFSQGLAQVKKSGKWGYINKQNQTVIPFEYEDTENDGYDLHRNSFSSDGLALVKKNGMYGYINTSGEVMVPIMYDYTRPASAPEWMAVVEKNDKYGYVNADGTEVIPLEYDDVYDFSEGLAAVKKDSKWGFVNATGAVVVPIIYGDVYDFSGGLALVNGDPSGAPWGKIGFVDTSGRVVLPLEYEYAYSFSEGLAVVQVKLDASMYGGRYGFINTSGAFINPPEYDYAYPFAEGLARVKKNGKWGFVNVSGTVVIPIEYDSVSAASGGLARVEKAGKYGYVNMSGDVVLPIEYDSFSLNSFREDTRIVKKNNKYFILEKTNVTTLPPTGTPGAALTPTPTPTPTPINEEQTEPTEPVASPESITKPPATDAGFTVVLTKTRVYDGVIFSDVADDAWYAGTVRFAYEYGMFNGTSAARFSPDGTATRAQIITVLARAAGVVTDGGANWYENAAEWAVENGISDGTNLDGNVTREQFATLLWRFAGRPETVGADVSFTDAGDISNWAKEAMLWAVSSGIVNGYPDGGVNPGGYATRAETAAMLLRYIGNSE
jgi:hypothetical protein